MVAVCRRAQAGRRAVWGCRGVYQLTGPQGSGSRLPARSVSRRMMRRSCHARGGHLPRLIGWQARGGTRAGGIEAGTSKQSREQHNRRDQPFVGASRTARTFPSQPSRPKAPNFSHLRPLHPFPVRATCARACPAPNSASRSLPWVHHPPSYLCRLVPASVALAAHPRTVKTTPPARTHNNTPTRPPRPAAPQQTNGPFAMRSDCI
jgi:hypothetical protein